MSQCKEPHDKSNSWWMYDGRGIPLCRVCDDCVKDKKRIHAHVLEYYDESDVDERIEEDY